jgi:hypothetical protein
MHALALLLLCYCNCYDEVCILTLVVEAVDTVDRGTLMVASQYEEVLWPAASRLSLSSAFLCCCCWCCV